MTSDIAIPRAETKIGLGSVTRYPARPSAPPNDQPRALDLESQIVILRKQLEVSQGTGATLLRNLRSWQDWAAHVSDQAAQQAADHRAAIECALAGRSSDLDLIADLCAELADRDAEVARLRAMVTGPLLDFEDEPTLDRLPVIDAECTEVRR